jgi:hypothetical protein
MADFNVRSDSVDVEQIMRQIRARIREKRGADYTEAELQQLATVKLERFLDPRGLRSDLVEQFRRHHTVSPELPKYEFEDTSLYETHRGPLRALRRLLNPLLKLFINPNAISHALHLQVRMNDDFHRRLRQREETDPLVYEVIHNLVVEITRLGIEVQNLKMRVESLSSRLDFDERRARALEGVVQYRPGAASARERARTQSNLQVATASSQPVAGPTPPSSSDSDQAEAAPPRRRRRRRRGRRGRGSTPPGDVSAAKAGGGSEARGLEETEPDGPDAATDDSTPDSEPDGPDGGPFPTDQ